MVLLTLLVQVTLPARFLTTTAHFIAIVTILFDVVRRTSYSLSIVAYRHLPFGGYWGRFAVIKSG